MTNFDFEFVTVHSGKFHADDVVGVALLKTINPEIRVIRTRNPEEFRGIVLDVGEGMFDHHGRAAGGQDRYGNPWCGATKLWFLGGIEKELFPLPKEAEKFYSRVLAPVALDDNGEKNNNSGFLFPFICDLYQGEVTADTMFTTAVEMAVVIIKAQIFKIKQETADLEELEGLPRDQPLVVMPRYLKDWAKFLGDNTAARMVIYPGNDGWNVSPVKEYNWDTGLINRADFPAEWMDPEGVWPQGLRFCHTGGFLAIFDTVFDAINAVEELLGIKKPVEEEEDLDEIWAREWLKSRRKRSFRPYRRRWKR